jgi:hypothetical protein
MWNLTAADIERAKEELKGRRAAIQARYEHELKQLEVDIADLETFEHFAVKFVADFKGEEPATEQASEAEAPAVAANVVSEPDNRADPVVSDLADEKAETVAGADNGVRKGSSRWRMHLGTGEASA